MDTVYTESVPTNCHIGGQSGQVTGIWRDAKGICAVFVKLDDGPMLHCEVSRVPAGERGAWREVTQSRAIDRDEFDRIIGADDFRKSCGWRR